MREWRLKLKMRLIEIEQIIIMLEKMYKSMNRDENGERLTNSEAAERYDYNETIRDVMQEITNQFTEVAVAVRCSDCRQRLKVKSRVSGAATVIYAQPCPRCRTTKLLSLGDLWRMSDLRSALPEMPTVKAIEVEEYFSEKDEETDEEAEEYFLRKQSKKKY